jgi:hypothetical protein
MNEAHKERLWEVFSSLDMVWSTAAATAGNTSV